MVDDHLQRGSSELALSNTPVPLASSTWAVAVRLLFDRSSTPALLSGRFADNSLPVIVSHLWYYYNSNPCSESHDIVELYIKDLLPF